MTWYRTVFADTPVTDRDSLVKALWCETSVFEEALASVHTAPRPVRLQSLLQGPSHLARTWVDIDPIPVQVGTARDGHPVYASYDPFKAQAEHVVASHAVDRRGWTREQWIADAYRLLHDADGSVLDLVNGHATALLDEIRELRDYAGWTKLEDLPPPT